MPKRKIHSWINRLMLQKSHDKVNAALDAPSKWMGRRHRRLFHDPLSAVFVASLVSHDKDAPKAAIVHIVLDELCSKEPVAKEILELCMLLRRKSSGRRPHSTRRTRRRRARRLGFTRKQNHDSH